MLEGWNGSYPLAALLSILHHSTIPPFRWAGRLAA
jgi:hypothetical protein